MFRDQFMIGKTIFMHRHAPDSQKLSLFPPYIIKKVNA